MELVLPFNILLLASHFKSTNYVHACAGQELEIKKYTVMGFKKYVSIDDMQ